MAWNQQEIRAHTGDEEETPTPTHVPRLLVLDRPREWDTKMNLILGIFTLQNFTSLSLNVTISF